MTCCGCFHRRKRGSLAFSDIYYRPCMVHGKCAFRSPLGPPENTCNCNSNDQQKVINKLLVESEYELGKEKSKIKTKKKAKEVREKTNYTEFEFADDAISLNNETFDERPHSSSSVGSNKSQKETTFTESPYITVNGKEELPCVNEIKNYSSAFAGNTKTESCKTNCNNRKEQVINNNIRSKNRFDGNYNKLAISNIYSYCTLPKRKNENKGLLHWVIPPKRITPDGTHIYYWCDLQKKCVNGKLLLKNKISKQKL